MICVKKNDDEQSMSYEKCVYSICRDTKNVDDDKGFYFVYSQPQTGKSLFTICMCILSVIKKRSAILVSRNVSDDIKQFKDMLDKILSKIGMEIDIVDGRNLNLKLTIKPFILLCLGNSYELDRVIEKDIVVRDSFDLYIDEIDDIDYGYRSDIPSKISVSLGVLKELSYRTFGISATPLDAIFSETFRHDIKELILTTPSDYRGFKDIIVSELEFNAVKRKCDDIDDVIENDPNFIPFLDFYSELKPIRILGKEESYPNLVLINKSRIVNDHMIMYRGIIERYSENVVIAYNGNGIKIYWKSIPKYIKIESKNQRFFK